VAGTGRPGGSGGLEKQTLAGAFGYARADGTDSVVYVAEVGKQRHAKELTYGSAQKRWQDWDLTAAAKGQPIDSMPVAYVRGDRTSSVVFCQFNGDIREMWLPGPEWHEASLRQAAGGAEPANCDQCRPSPVALANGQSVVVYLGLDNTCTRWCWRAVPGRITTCPGRVQQVRRLSLSYGVSAQ